LPTDGAVFADRAGIRQSADVHRPAIALAAAALVTALGLSGCTSHGADSHARPATAAQPGSSEPAGAAATPADGQRTLTILGAGDELLHPQVWQQGHEDAVAAGKSGYYFDPIFAGVKPAIGAASLAICHMETPLAAAGGPFDGYPRFSVPPQIATTIHDIGYDTCSTASNHTLDQGTAGIKRTLDALDAAGVAHTGSYRTQADSTKIDIVKVTSPQGGAPVKVAQLSYTFGFNGLKRPQPWVANQTDATAILAAAHRAKQAGAEIVVLSIHWGVEYDHTPNGDQKALAAKLLASPDLDLILGCHEHVVQPIAKVAGKWVAYGMGNQVARHAQPENANREGIMPEFTFTEESAGHWKVTTAAVIPTWVSLSPAIRVIDLPAALASGTLSAGTRKIYQGALDRITGYVDSLGADVTVTSGIPS
jgi:capsule synthesis protein PGA_cap